MAHLGTYNVGGITYDTHTGQAIAGTDTVNTEFVEEYNSTYNEVNLTPYSQLQDNDNVFGDQQASLFTNGNGDATLTFDAANSNTATGFPPFYDFEKGEFTNIGKGFYTKQMGNSSQEEIDAYLTQVENELKSALIADYNKQKLSNPNAKPNPLLNLNSTVSEETVEPNPNTDEGSTNYLEYGFGKVDKIIKKLSLRNLTYPLDADFGNTQDYMQINQFKYRPVNQDLFFGGSNKSDKNSPFNLLASGVPMASPKEEFLGLVKLPMPNSLSDSNNVSWGADQLNSLTAAVSSAVFGQGEQLARGFGDAIEAFKDGKNIFQSLSKSSKELFNTAKKSGSQFIDQSGKIISEITTQGTDLNLLGQAIAGSALLNIGQFGISPETILGRGQGVVPNSNLALLFNSPTLREFTFSWKMTPRSREEAIRIRNIIRFFKQGMAPKKGFNTATGAASYFLGTPNVFDIIFKTTRDKYDILNENDAVLRIKTCACTGSAVNYTPDGMWNAYEQGQPVAVTLSLRFSELEPIFDIDYDENAFNYDKDRPDLRPVPINAVGY